jgi:hypothetical protein
LKRKRWIESVADVYVRVFLIPDQGSKFNA